MKNEKPGAPERWYVYILECRDHSFYVGITNDLERRVREHDAGTGGKYTRSHRPVRLVHQEALKTKSAALIREAVIKRLTRKEKERIVSGI